MLTLEVGFKLDIEQFTNLQKVARRHIVFSVTDDCPFSCQHCLVGSNDKTSKKNTISISQINRFIQDFPRLAQLGVDRISVTGGEPLLYPEHIKLLSRGAVKNGMTCTVVTGCFWAVSVADAMRTVSQFDDISCWHLSVDVFHEHFISREQVAGAAEAILTAGKLPVFRLTVVEGDKASQDIYDYFQDVLPEVPVVVQSLFGNQDEDNINVDPNYDATLAWLCNPSGMLVRPDGTVAPCCGPLANSKLPQPPLHLPAASEEHGLLKAYLEWFSSPLLRLMLTAGMRPLATWAEEGDSCKIVLKTLNKNPCDLCVRLWSDPELADKIRKHIESNDVISKINNLTRAIFGED